ncbi:terpene synthase [Apiospora marii]|uniref:terpene synthase n=1 Tax=Apiospora marii TaxID=335849 RepID=UPI00312D5969
MSSAKPDSANSRVTVSLPDMFKGFLVGDPTVNPFYEDARAESEKWLQSAMALSPKQAKRVQYCNFTYFVAVLIPHAPKERLKIASDWGNWIFMFDDMFDEGELRDDPDTSQRIVHNLLSIMGPERQRTSEEPVVMAHDSFYQQFARHVADFTADQTPTILEMVKTRRMSIGVFPMYPLIEFAYDLNLPDEVFLDPTVQKLENLGAEFVML